jgi:hypothetical protein
MMLLFVVDVTRLDGTLSSCLLVGPCKLCVNVCAYFIQVGFSQDHDILAVVVTRACWTHPAAQTADCMADQDVSVAMGKEPEQLVVLHG